MPIEYRRLMENDLDIFIEMRINQLREEGAEEDIDLESALRDYYERHMADGTFVSWIAVDEDNWYKWNVICRKTSVFRMP